MTFLNDLFYNKPPLLPLQCTLEGVVHLKTKLYYYIFSNSCALGASGESLTVAVHPSWL